MEQHRTIRLGLLGLGTVGTGVVKTLEARREELKSNAGITFDLVRVLVRNLQKPRGVKVSSEILTADPIDVIADPSIDVVIEVMGGKDLACQLVSESLRLGKHVITANKELIATEGARLQKLAQECGVHLLFEASVCGAIPVIRMLQTYYSINRISKISGIVNGTTNFILTQMTDHQSSFAEALAKAQELGYAESDPTSDVEGWDAAYKLSILSALTIGKRIELEQIDRQGISQLTQLDLELIGQLGGRVKLLAEVEADEHGQFISASVRPCALSLSHPLAAVSGVQNAVVIASDLAGELTFLGPGAGELPTASAVTEDLLSLSIGTADFFRKLPIEAHPIAASDDRFREEILYIRLTASQKDRQKLLDCLRRALFRDSVQLLREASLNDDVNQTFSFAAIVRSNAKTVEKWKLEFEQSVTGIDLQLLPAKSNDPNWILDSDHIATREFKQSEVV